ncbi:MAG: XTP/dITP diphosphatase [Thermodesulfobacteriota bacterium]|nr:XTP/dITP diphosphatase [Thermodesulfobacteriota bacterium]
MKEQIIILATKNQGKIKEIKELLAGQPVQLLDLSDFGPTPEPIEDADTFEDNAYHKAYFYARILGFPALADDSGLVVEALSGAPGVLSARYAGEGATDEDRSAKILKEMEGQTSRKAAFVCALVLAVPLGPGLTWVGRCEGEITTKPRGQNGFGYDPIFHYPPLGKTFAELTSIEKSRVSHRGQALTEFKSEFSKVMIWLNQRLAETNPPTLHP